MIIVDKKEIAGQTFIGTGSKYLVGNVTVSIDIWIVNIIGRYMNDLIRKKIRTYSHYIYPPYIHPIFFNASKAKPELVVIPGRAGTEHINYIGEFFHGLSFYSGKADIGVEIRKFIPAEKIEVKCLEDHFCRDVAIVVWRERTIGGVMLKSSVLRPIYSCGCYEQKATTNGKVKHVTQ